jgi:hypothetical protein
MLLLQLEESERGARIAWHRTGADAAVEPPSLPWHQGAAGTILLGIALPLVVQLIQLALGLAKLP